jgi:hypothetical protein
MGGRGCCWLALSPDRSTSCTHSSLLNIAGVPNRTLINNDDSNNHIVYTISKHVLNVRGGEKRRKEEKCDVENATNGRELVVDARLQQGQCSRKQM